MGRTLRLYERGYARTRAWSILPRREKIRYKTMNHFSGLVYDEGLRARDLYISIKGAFINYVDKILRISKVHFLKKILSRVT